MVTRSDWQPGDPLENPHDCYHRRLFEVIDVPDHIGGDAASWPNPGRYDLGRGDELDDFIAHWRLHQETTT
jgi:hypothetical protein